MMMLIILEFQIYIQVFGSIGIYVKNMMNNDNITIAGIEIVEEAVKLAKINAKNNGIKNYMYISSTAKDILKEVRKNDIIIVDPPRKGLDRKLVEGLIQKEVKNIVYVSCNSNTLARD